MLVSVTFNVGMRGDWMLLSGPGGKKFRKEKASFSLHLLLLGCVLREAAFD